MRDWLRGCVPQLWPRGVVALACCVLLGTMMPQSVTADNMTCPLTARCVPTFLCPRAMLNSRYMNVPGCYMPSGTLGVECPVEEPQDEPEAAWGSRSMNGRRVMAAVSTAERQLSRMLAAAERTPVLLPEDGASFGHFHSVLGPSEENARTDARDGLNGDPFVEEARNALRGVLAAQALLEPQGLGAREDSGEDDEIISTLMPTDLCPRQPECDPASLYYRRYDGTCNNEQHPRWGAANTPHSRLFPARYHDGIWQPRRSVTGGPLPSARLLSTTVFPDLDLKHHYASLFVMLFGQVLSHDLLLTPSIQRANSSGVQCCEPGDVGLLPSSQRHFACMPIVIPDDDPFFARFGKRCMNFVRSQLGLRQDCQMSPALQMNTVTHWLDGSVLYGSNEKMSSDLREGVGGRMRMSWDGAVEQLPLTNHKTTCGAVSTPDTCYLSGDIRGNQMVGLLVVVRLFVRQHNALADALAGINPHWNDERLFQETRRIVIAELQHITYKEFLPVLVGHVAMSDYDLWPTPHGYSNSYDPGVDPATTVEFATAAYRYGHSSVEGFIKLLHNGFNLETILLTDITLNPSRMRHASFSDEFFNTLTREPMQNVDPFISKALTNYLFNGDKPFGVDLAAINIQRGRDHGLPTYNDLRTLQGLSSAQTFDDFRDRIPTEGVKMLRHMYASPEDVDLFVGGLLELPAHGAIVGPTFQGIIADQFSKLKTGDRFFYEYGGFPNSFTPGQLHEIKQTRLARIMCDINDHLALHQVSPFPFLVSTVPGI